MLFIFYNEKFHYQVMDWKSITSRFKIRQDQRL